MDKLKEIVAYCAANIEDFDEKVKLALGYMDRRRCPLSQAAPVFYDELCEAVCEWAEANDVNLEGFDVEEVLMYNE